MAEITFTKIGNEYVAEMQVSGDFNLHIERADISKFRVLQRTSSEGKFAIVKNLGIVGDPVVDMDFSGVVYPKTIRIESGLQPSVAIITLAK